MDWLAKKVQKSYLVEIYRLITKEIAKKFNVRIYQTIGRQSVDAETLLTVLRFG